MTRFLIAKGIAKSPPLLSLDTSVKLGLLHVINVTQEEAKQLTESCTGTSPTDPVVSTLMSEYRDVFFGLGKHKHIKAKLIVDESIQPVAHRQRRIPSNLAKKAAHEELRLREQGVIETVPNKQPTTWCTNPVIAPFVNLFRHESTTHCNSAPCYKITYCGRHKVQTRGCHCPQSPNEGYCQLELDESSRHMTTFYGTECKMRYIRLNYVTISAQDNFDKAMDDTVSGLLGELYMRNDFIVFGRDNTEHDTALENLLQRFRECGLTFNPKKCKFRLPQIEFFGFVF